MSSESHHIAEEPSNTRQDGPSVVDVKNANFSILTMVHEVFNCRNEHCDEAETRNHYYAYSDDLQRHEQTCDIYDDSIPTSVELVNHGTQEPVVRAECPDCGESWRLSPEKTTVDETFGLCSGKPPRQDPL